MMNRIIIPNTRWSHLADLAPLANGCFLYLLRDVLKLRADINVTKVFRKPRSEFISVIWCRSILRMYLHNVNIFFSQEKSYIILYIENTLEMLQDCINVLGIFQLHFFWYFFKISMFFMTFYILYFILNFLILSFVNKHNIYNTK